MTGYLGLPALGLDVVYVGMLAGADIGDDLADIRAVFDDGIALLHGLDRKFVSDRYVARCLELDVLVLIHYPAANFIPRLNALNNDYADTVALVMYNKIYHSDSPEL